MSSSKPHKQPFWLGGVAGSMAACFTHPLDQTKYRMQVMTHKACTEHSSTSPAVTASFRSGKASPPPSYGSRHIPQLDSVYIITSQVKCGNEVVRSRSRRWPRLRVRLQRVALLVRLAILRRWHSSGCAQTVRRIPLRGSGTSIASTPFSGSAGKRGPERFIRGLGPNVTRSVSMNVSQIVSYSATKQHPLNLGATDGLPTHFLASFVAGTVATTVCAPADVLKSRVQNAVVVDGIRPSVTKIIAESLKKEGPMFLMRGWTPAWMRLAPYTIFTFVFMEQLKKLVDKPRSDPKLKQTIASPLQKI